MFTPKQAATPTTTTVLQSFPDPKPTTNPYLVMLAQSLGELNGVTVLTFSWRRALLGHYDVFHVHWPEILVSGSTPARKLVRQFLFALLLLRLSVIGVPLVRTAHNEDLPSDISAREQWLLRLAERRTTLWITLNPVTEVPTAAAREIIPHGHYRNWFSPYQKPASVTGHLSYIGLIRRYKGVDQLLRTFMDLPDEGSGFTLEIAGKPSTSELAYDLLGMAHGDPRIAFTLHFLSDEQLVNTIGRAELVILPAPDMHNSGGAFAALSLDRPILVIDNPVNRLLRAEVGDQWVHLYSGELSPHRVREALRSVRHSAPGRQPDLSARNWPRSAALHLHAYQRALSLKRQHRVDPPGRHQPEARRPYPAATVSANVGPETERIREGAR